MSEVLTKLSISVSGKADGKQAVADMIAESIKWLGGSIPQRKGDNNGQYLTVEMPAEAMARVGDGKGIVPVMVQQDAALVAIDDDRLKKLCELLASRRMAAALLAAEPDARVQYATAPAFVDRAELETLLLEAAQIEVDRCDAILGAWGFRFTAHPGDK